MAKKKLKPLSPTLREKKRYLAFEVLSEDKISDFDAVSEGILGASTEFLGQLGMSKAGVMILKDKYDKEMQRGIIRANHKNIDNLRAALMMIEEIENKKVIVKSLGVSGVLNKAVKKYIQGQLHTAA